MLCLDARLSLRLVEDCFILYSEKNVTWKDDFEQSPGPATGDVL